MGLVIRVIVAVVAGFGICSFSRGAEPVSFCRDVAPILLQHCQECHGPGKAKGKFRLDSFERLMKGGMSGRPSITAGKTDESELYRLITTSDEDDRMPQKADPLPAAPIETIKKWIEQGAKFDGGDRAASLVALVPAKQEQGPPEVYPRPVPIAALAFSPDGRELAASGYHEVTLWDPSDGKLLWRIRNLPQRVWGIAWSPDGKRLAIAGGTPGQLGELRICDADGNNARILERIADIMLVVRFSPDGTRVAAGGADNAIRIYDVESGRREWLIEQHADWVTDLAFSPDGSRLASASRDKSGRVFDVATRSMEAAYLGHTEGLLCLAWTPDGKRLFSSGLDRTIHQWNAADGKPVGKEKFGPVNGDVYKLVVMEDRLIGCGGDGSVREFSISSKKPIRTLSERGDCVYSLAADSKSGRVAAGDFRGIVRVWNADSGRLLKTFTAAPGLQ